MARAKLYHAFAIDQEVHEASQVDPTLFDPILRVNGDLPGLTRPFRVIRYYLGPQGTYTERFVLADPHGQELASSVVRRIELEGQMAESRFASPLEGVRIDSPEEHELIFYLDDEKVGSVPVFIEAGLTGDGDVPTAEAFTNAVNRTDTLTLSVAQADGTVHEQTVWFVTQDRRLYVVTGPDEQRVPGLADAGEAGVSAQGEADGQPAEVTADVRLVPPGDPGYYKFAEAVLDGRVEVADPQEALRRWTETCQLVELTPRLGQGYGAPPEAPASAASAGQEPEGDSKGQEDVQVDAQIDQEVYDQLIAEGKSERMARSKAKAAYVRAEKKRLAAEGDAGSQQDQSGGQQQAGGQGQAGEQDQTGGQGQAGEQGEDEDIHVDPQIDQEVYDQLIAEGKSERMARSKAKAAYVRAEKKRLAAEREGSSA